MTTAAPAAASAPRSARAYYDKVYAEKPPAQHQWVAGTPSPELVGLVWDGTIAPGSRVLEIGCGVGTESVFLAVRGMKVTGVDLSTSAVEIASRLAALYGASFDFRQGDALALDLPEASFDVVCDQGVFHHLTDEERPRYAASLARVLRPGGLLLLRCFSDKIPGGGQPRRIKSRELLDTLMPAFELEHMERVLSFSTDAREKPLGWHSIWVRR